MLHSNNITSKSQNESIFTQNSFSLDYFKESLEQNGIKLSFNDDANVLTQEQAVVVANLERFLTKEDTEYKIAQLLKGFKYLCQKQKYLKKGLLPSELKKNAEFDNGKIEQESVFRLLLKVHHLQNEIIELILDEITTTASEDEDDTSWLRLLLNPLRYLPYIKDGETLMTKLLDILDISTLPVQLEILDCIPEILPDCHYYEIAQQLIKLLDQNENLTGAIVDCLNALNLQNETRTQIQEKVLARISSGNSTAKVFPILLEFLLSEAKMQNVVATLHQIRNFLDNTMSSTDGDCESSKVMIFHKLKAVGATRKVYFEGWLNVVSHVETHTDHKPVDLLILFMLHSAVKAKRKAIESLLRKRVKDGLMKSNLLEMLFDTYVPQQLFKDYYDSTVEIGCSLIRSSNDRTVQEFSATLFRILFAHKYTKSIHRQELVDNLIVLTSMNDAKYVSPVLDIFKLFLVENAAKFRQHTILFFRLLEKLDSFDVGVVKEIFEILCALTCSPESEDSLSGLKDELHMIVRKQLASSKRVVKYKGIVSSVVLARYTASVTEDQSELGSEMCSFGLGDLPEGNARQAAGLLELANTCVRSSSEYTGLFYDQLASMIARSEDLDRYFVMWLYETVNKEFVDTFVVSGIPSDLKEEYSLNASEELVKPVFINIGGLTGTAANTENCVVSTLAPQFRLLRLLHHHCHNGDLSSIDALLGAGLVLSHTDEFDELEHEELTLTADCLFHSINWFRELINGFILQNPQHVKRKILARLKHLIELERLLDTCMANVPGHKLPRSYFEGSSRGTAKVDCKAKRPKKKIKSAEIANNDTIASTSALPEKIVPKTMKKSTQEMVFRELDTDILVLLRHPLKISPIQTQRAMIEVDQLKFILKDFVKKLKFLMEGKKIGLSNLNSVEPKNLIKDCTWILHHVNQHLHIIAERLKNLLEKAKGVQYATEMYTPEATDLKTCFGLVLESFSLIFNWSGFRQTNNLDSLRDILKVFESETSLNSVNRLVVHVCDNLSAFVDNCLNFSHGVFLIKAMIGLNAIKPNVATKKKIIVTAKVLLDQRWYDAKGCADSGKKYSENAEFLIARYLEGANIKTINGLVGTLQKEAVDLKTKDDYLTMLRCIDKSNFHIFFRALCNALFVRLKLEVQSLTNQEHLELWLTTALTMQGLMSVVKVQETKTNMASFLKRCVSILKLFLSHGMPIIEITLRSNPDKIIEILKTLQNTTRFLHHLCCYSKLVKDTSLVPHVPQFRLTLETLVYRVKAALVANDCSAAFWMGNLKNRNLQGEDIISQSTVLTDSNVTAGSDEEIPEDESLNDESMSTHEDDDNSDSEVYD